MDLLRRKGKRNKSNREDASTLASNNDVRKASPEKIVEQRQERSSSKNLAIEKEAEPVTTPTREPYTPEGTVNTENNGPVYRESGKGGPWFTSRQIHLFKKPPPAEEAAYSGPPRYDWVDIVSIPTVQRWRLLAHPCLECSVELAAVACYHHPKKKATMSPQRNLVFGVSRVTTTFQPFEHPLNFKSPYVFRLNLLKESSFSSGGSRLLMFRD